MARTLSRRGACVAGGLALAAAFSPAYVAAAPRFVPFAPGVVQRAFALQGLAVVRELSPVLGHRPSTNPESFSVFWRSNPAHISWLRIYPTAVTAKRAPPSASGTFSAPTERVGNVC